jgi:predicted transcriptional regulator
VENRIMARGVPVTVRLKPDLWHRVEELAKADRRPPSQLLQLMILDAVESRPEGKAA